MIPTNSLELEIGKKYKVADESINFVEVVFISNADHCPCPVVAVMYYKTGTHAPLLHVYTLQGIHEYSNDYDITGEYHGPVTVTRYVNVYPDHIGLDYGTREEADANRNDRRIACIKVTAVEGQYDD
jgi:hypothetical protein